MIIRALGSANGLQTSLDDTESSALPFVGIKMKESFIKTQDHFMNYLNKTIKLNSDKIDTSKLLPLKFYIDTIFNKGLTNDYTWKLRNDFEYLYENKLLDFINSKKMIKGTFQKVEENILYKKYDWTNEFLELLRSLKGRAGVYIFTSSKNKTLYIGQSVNLQERILSSFNERFTNYPNKVYLKCVVCESAIDSTILEVYFIGKLKPVFNSTAKYKGKLSIIVKNIPEFTNRVLCTIPAGKKNDK